MIVVIIRLQKRISVKLVANVFINLLEYASKCIFRAITGFAFLSLIVFGGIYGLIKLCYKRKFLSK